MSIAALLAEARLRLPPAEARQLLAHVLGKSAVWLEAHRDEAIAPAHAERFRSLVARRLSGEPVAYLLGSREFYGRDFLVTPDVLIPRPESELLVDIAKTKVGSGRTASILDLGTGSGCIAIALALELQQAHVCAVDVSPAALRVAEDNARTLDARVSFRVSDWFSDLPLQRFDLIVANPPYVAAGDAHLLEGDLRFEPVSALTDHADGLTDIRHIVASAPGWLEPGGWLFLEHGYDQAASVDELLNAAGFAGIEQHRDLAGIVRASGGRWC